MRFDKGGVLPAPPFKPARLDIPPSRALDFLSRHSGMVRQHQTWNLEIPVADASPRNDDGKTNARTTMKRLIASLLFALAGIALFGHGAYIHAKALLAQVLLERAFDESIATGHIVKPWSWADTWPVARIEIKRLHASAIVLAGSSGQALAFGPGHVELTPDAGERGAAVYSAHRDTHFRFLREVAIGDEIDITRGDGKHFRYRADSSQVVRFDASGIDPQTDGYELVLSTCWPFDALTGGPERYVLHATMIEPNS
jgi:sortase A